MSAQFSLCTGFPSAYIQRLTMFLVLMLVCFSPVPSFSCWFVPSFLLSSGFDLDCSWNLPSPNPYGFHKRYLLFYCPVSLSVSTPANPVSTSADPVFTPAVLVTRALVSMPVVLVTSSGDPCYGDLCSSVHA